MKICFSAVFALKCHSAALDRDLRHCLHVLQALCIQELLHVLLVTVRLLLGYSRHVNVARRCRSNYVVLGARHGNASAAHPALVSWAQCFLFLLVEVHFLALAIGFRALAALLRVSLHLVQISLFAFFTGHRWKLGNRSVFRSLKASANSHLCSHSLS